jgi:hypothetical protein
VDDTALGFRELEIGGKESEPSVFSADPDDADLAAAVFEHHPLIIVFAVERDRDGTASFGLETNRVHAVDTIRNAR